MTPATPTHLTTTTLTAPACVLLAASSLDRAGRATFALADVAVAAWRMFPDRFSMGDGHDYPDTHAVIGEFYGKRGLIGRGLLRKHASLLAMTNRGRLAVHTCHLGTKQLIAVVMPMETEQLVLRLMDTESVRKWQCNQKEELLFPDAWSFWDLPETPERGIVAERLSRTGQMLSAVRSHPCGRLALEVHLYLTKRFATHVKLMANRRVKAMENKP